MVLETGSGAVWTVTFHPDGKHVFGQTQDAIRRWQIAEGQRWEIKRPGEYVNTIAVAASVWDAELREKAVAVEDTVDARTVNVAPECPRFATGTLGGEASVWSTTTGERLVGLLLFSFIPACRLGL